MEHFSDEHSTRLLDKQWLVKVDNENSTPYLLKFYSSTAESRCCILVTDTKNVWFESLSSNQFARRWREVNPLRSKSFASSEEEVDWRTRNLELLSAAHTIGNMSDLSFGLGKTQYADIAFELECEGFKWQWEPNFVGPKISAEILSKQLIMPLISVAHLAFSSAESIGEMSDSDLENAVDKVGRTARRTLDTHIKNAISKPRLATTLCRMTAMFNFIPELPHILSSAEKQGLGPRDPDVVSTGMRPRSRGASSDIADVEMANSRAQSPSLHDWLGVSQPTGPVKTRTQGDDSATENSDNEMKEIADIPKIRGGTNSGSHSTSSATLDKNIGGSSGKVPLVKKTKILPSSSDNDSPPVRLAKKVRQKSAVSSDDDSDSEPKRHGTSAGTSSNRGGTRQPIKRGGRRF